MNKEMHKGATQQMLKKGQKDGYRKNILFYHFVKSSGKNLSIAFYLHPDAILARRWKRVWKFNEVAVRHIFSVPGLI
ncbi:MAG: hypothetical protein JWR18_2466 [Segetibacter sp.]|nr:hypothetical protein [Segetibacter sp.]